MKKLIKTDINNFYKDLGYSKEEKKEAKLMAVIVVLIYTLALGYYVS